MTNPPYGRHGLADAFIRQALSHAKQTGGKVAMLLNMRSLAHPKRTAKYRKNPPARLYILEELTCLPSNAQPQQKPAYAKQQYVWSIWEPGFQDMTELDWLSPQDFADA